MGGPDHERQPKRVWLLGAVRTSKSLHSASSVAIVGLLIYLFIFFTFLVHLGDLRSFIQIGTTFINKSQSSNVIKIDPNFIYPKNGLGFDGQFAYYIALDPAHARFYLDNPPYRYGRILYPLAARFLAFGNPNEVPLSLIVVNLVAVTTGTWVIAAWCIMHKLSPWFALVYTLFIGQVMSFTRDLTEILAYALVAVAIYIFDRWQHFWLLSAIMFGLSVLARETTLVFVVLFLLKLLFQTNLKATEVQRFIRAGLFASIAIGPALLWQTFLAFWLGSFGWKEGESLFRLPFSALYQLYPLDPEKLQVVQITVVPGVLCLLVAFIALFQDVEVRRRVELWALILNATLFIALLPAPSLVELFASARVSLGVVLSAIYVLPYLKSRGWFYVCSGLWLASTAAFLINPVLQLFHPGSHY